MTPQRVVLGAWIAMIGLATVRYVNKSKGLPPPSIYLGSAVLFTLLFGAASVLGPLPAVIAVSADVGALLTPYLRGSDVGPLNQLASLLDSISGAPATSGGGSGSLTP